ncbi:BppU family phage baseplate upper protein, partial [Clostridium chrysemydis]|uniref:BppU family phage baseplate upper protein n=1 Tax=Clostridium chrysemydis TaxID=2665504 RepID=UPI003F3E1755
MALNNKLIVLDIDKRFNRLLLGKSLDTTGARSYRMRLIYNNSAFDLTGLTVQVGGTKPDGFGVLSSCKVIDVLKGIIEVDFTTQMLTTPGILKLEIIFLKGDIRLSSIPFEVEVIKSATNYNQMISSNDFLVFQDELRKMRAQMDAAVDKINARYNITEDKANKLI